MDFKTHAKKNKSEAKKSGPFCGQSQVMSSKLIMARVMEKYDLTTRMGFEPTRAEHIGLAVQRLNHSATSSDKGHKQTIMIK